MSGVLTERRAAILDAVRRNGAVSVRELAHRFDVTQQTIRRDLHILDSNGLIQKGFGGAFASRADGVEAAFWNPAGLAATTKLEITGSHVEFYQQLRHEKMPRGSPACSTSETVPSAYRNKRSPPMSA